jgi:DNA polymerase elongation subunit (family B)
MIFIAINNLILNMEKNEIFAYSWHVDQKDTEITVIRIYGLTRKNENICLLVNNFTPYVYIELPDTVQWNDSNAQLVATKIDSMLRERRPLNKQLMFKKRLYYANMDPNQHRRLYPYLFCNFSSVEDIRRLTGVLRKPIHVVGIGNILLKVHEHNASPILQLTSLRKLPTAGWIEFVGKPTEDKVTTCDYEYNVKWKNMSPIDSNTVARPFIMGYDIEVNSSVPSAMPKAERIEDKIFQISCIFARQGSKEETYEKYLLTLGEPDVDTLGHEVKALLFTTEHDLLLGFTKLIQEKQPNVIVGYNIFGFDIPYMIERARLAFCIGEFDQQGFLKHAHSQERIITWSSSAYKNQSFQFLDAEGRIFVDLLPLVKRDYQMSNYKLSTIASHFLKGQTKDPLDAKGIFKCYRIGMNGGRKGRKAIGLVGKYCVKDSVLTVKLFEVLTTWVGLCEMSKVTNVPIFALYTQGQQLKVFSQVYKKTTHENTVVEKDGYITKDDDYYVGATVFPPVPGLYEKVVPFDFCSLYPTTIIAYNISWDTLVVDEDVPDRLCHVFEWEDHIGCVHDPKEIRKVELNKIISKMDEEVKELRKQRDARGNKSRKEEYVEKIKEVVERCKPFRDERTQLKKTKNKHTMCCKRRYRWLKSPMGVLPEILTHLLDSRKATKKEMKDVTKKMQGLTEGPEKDSLQTLVEVLDKRQLALKVSANSAYGSLGVRKGYLPFMPGAMSTTYKGREAVTLTAETIQRQYKGHLVYGDTDSNYLNFPHLETAKECWEYSEKVATEISKLFPNPMSLAFEEKVYWRFFIITKKRYMCLSCNKEGVIDEEINKKGVLLQRRDNCQYIRNVYAHVIMSIFNKEAKDDILYYITEEINKLCARFYGIDKFVITKSVGDIGDLVPVEGTDDEGKKCLRVGDYKIRKLLPGNDDGKVACYEQKECTSITCKCDSVAGLCDTCKEYYLKCLPAQVQLAEKMRRRGQLVAPGSRIEYVISTNGGHKANQYIKIESSEYLQKYGHILEIDYMYYLKQMTNPIDQLINIAFAQHKDCIDFVLKQYKYRLNVRQPMLNSIKNMFRPKLKFL